MKIVVTAEDVREARKPDCDGVTDCAVARALQRALPEGTVLTVGFRALHINNASFDLGEDVADFIWQAIDPSGVAPETITPYEFDLEFGDEVSACS